MFKRVILTLIALLAEFGIQIGFNVFELAYTGAVLAFFNFEASFLASAVVFFGIFVVCCVIYGLWIYLYDLGKTDIYFIEYLKMKVDGERTFYEKLPDAIALSVIWPGDAVLSTLLLRDGANKYDGLSFKDVLVFLTMTSLDAGTGTLVSFFGVSAALGLVDPKWGLITFLIVGAGLLWRFSPGVKKHFFTPSDNSN